MRILKSHPLLKLANSYLIDSPQPSNLSYLWNFGSLLAFCLVIQMITGIILAMHYNPSVLEAFNSVEHIMRDVNNGWMIRYLQSNTASALLFIVYLYIHRVLNNKVLTSSEWVLTSPPKPHVFISLPLNSKFSTRPVIAKSMLFTAFNMFISNKYIMPIIKLVKHLCYFLVVLVSICITLVSHISFISFFWEVNKSTCLLYLITTLIMVSSAFIIWSILTKKSMPNTSTIKEKFYNNYKNMNVIAYVLLILCIPKATMYSLIKLDIQDEFYILYILSLVLLFSPIQFWLTSFSLALYRENGLEKSISIASVSIRQMDYWYFFILILVTSCIVLLKINCIEYILLLYFIPTLDSTLPSIRSNSTCKRTFTMDSPWEKSEICKKLRRTPNYIAWINQDNGGGSDRGHETDSSTSTRRSSSSWEEDAPEKVTDILSRLSSTNTSKVTLKNAYLNCYFWLLNDPSTTLPKTRELQLLDEVRQQNRNHLKVMEDIGMMIDPFNTQDRSDFSSRWYNRPEPDFSEYSLKDLRQAFIGTYHMTNLPDFEMEQAENRFERVDLVDRSKAWTKKFDDLTKLLEERVKKET